MFRSRGTDIAASALSSANAVWFGRSKTANGFVKLTGEKMTTFIVECSICGQPWEVKEHMLSAPPAYGIQVPAHYILERSQGMPMEGVPCQGRQVPGLGFGPRDQWELNWSLRHPLDQKPAVLDGSAVKLLRGG